MPLPRIAEDLAGLLGGQPTWTLHLNARLVPHRGFALFPGLYSHTYYGTTVQLRDAEAGLEAYTVLKQPPGNEPSPRPVIPVVPVPIGSPRPAPVGVGGRPELGY